jgi:hypothetical protein
MREIRTAANWDCLDALAWSKGIVVNVVGIDSFFVASCSWLHPTHDSSCTFTSGKPRLRSMKKAAPARAPGSQVRMTVLVRKCLQGRSLHGRRRSWCSSGFGRPGTAPCRDAVRVHGSRPLSVDDSQRIAGPGGYRSRSGCLWGPGLHLLELVAGDAVHAVPEGRASVDDEDIPLLSFCAGHSARV